MKHRYWLATALIISFSPLAAEEDGGPLSFPKWSPTSIEFTRTQASDWMSTETFAIGRWDGSISVFRTPEAGEYSPVLLNVWHTKDGSGVEMVHALGEAALLVSNGPSSLAVWMVNTSVAPMDLPYDPKFGIANSAISLSIDGADYIVTGHEYGDLLFWRKEGSTISFDRSLGVASNDPIPSPYPLKNIRGLSVWRGQYIVTGSEDGDLTVIDPSTDTVTSRRRYNEMAQRGINNISVAGDYILLANCSVGRGDKNLWLFKINDTSETTMLDAIDLKDDQSRPQSFNFDA